MYLSLLHRRILLSGTLLAAVGLATAPALAQNSKTAGSGVSHHRRLKLPPLGDLSTPQQRADFMAQVRALNPGLGGSNISGVAAHIANMPVYP